MCHILLMMPIISIVFFFILPMYVALPLYLSIAVISAILYLALLKAMKTKPTTGKEGLIGEEGRVLKALNPKGQIEIHGEIWQAYSEKHIPPGKTIKVESIKGLTLKVREK